MILRRKFSSVLLSALTVASVVTFAAPAHAAALTDATATSTDTTSTSGTNTAPITISATSVTANASSGFRVVLPTGWTFVSAPWGSNTCPSWMTTTISSLVSCGIANNQTGATVLKAGVLASGVNVSITFATGSLNLGTSRDFTVEFVDLIPAQIDVGIATLGGGAPTPTPTPTPAPTPAANSTLALTGADSSTVNLAAGVGVLLAGSLCVAVVRRRRLTE